MPEKLAFNLIYCEFDEKFGPMPKYSYPKLEYNFEMSISIKTISILTSDDVIDQKSLAFIPFPNEKKKGVVRNFELHDPALRGGVGVCSLTIIFDEADDLIYYKYVKDLEFIFDKATEKIKKLRDSKADDDVINEEVKKIHKDFLSRLEELRAQEKGTRDISEAFPEEEPIENQEVFAFKIVVCGDPACGKTSTILKFTDSAFRRTYIPTIGVNITRKDVLFNNNKVSLILWDIAGQMKFEVMRSKMYEGADGIMLLFDITRRSTFDSISNWYSDIKKALKNKDDLMFLLCGNKDDLQDEKVISSVEAKALADELNIVYLEISALTGKNITRAFQTIAKMLAKESS
jgi:small GTP-binding protein